MKHIINAPIDGSSLERIRRRNAEKMHFSDFDKRFWGFCTYHNRLSREEGGILIMPKVILCTHFAQIL